MGNLVAVLSKRAMRPLKNFAVEARTERILAKEKPTPAPWHPSTQKKIDELMKANPNLLEEQAKKNQDLDNRLKEVYVTSKDPVLPKEVTVEKVLPVERKNIERPEFGYHEPVKVTKGKLSIRQALLMIGKHHQDPSTYNAFILAKEFTVHPKVTENILKYFRTFEYYQPPKVKTQITVKDYINLKSLPKLSKEGEPHPLTTEDKIKS